MGFSTGAFAQATRTWVSGVGDDVNPCSRTAPCKTWAGAISKTAEGGEIDPLDPAGYGTLTITKAITVDGGTGSGWGHTLSAGSPSGFVVNVTGGTHVSDAVVILRNLTFNGAIQSPTVGATQCINYIKAAQLIIEHCQFENVSTTGITQGSAATTTSLRVEDCVFDNVGTGMLVTTSAGFAVAQVDNCRFNTLTGGVNTTSNAFVTVRNSMFAGVTGANGGVRANTGCQVNVSDSMFANCGTGANIAGGTIRLTNNDFFNNTTGIGGGTAESANNNRFRGNGTDGNVSNVITVK
ncbi:MAG TPA: hypothetical protein VJU77_09300 [Chthoniobacterales bacterium]|nr:hypothetical protein [Chthoniobacterales bacterium]